MTTIVETEILHGRVSAAVKASGILQLNGINAGYAERTEKLNNEQKLQ